MPMSLREDFEMEEKRRSEEAYYRHIATGYSGPQIVMYSTTGSESRLARRAPAYHIPPNTSRPVPIETPYFAGKVLLMYPPEAGSDSGGESNPYGRHFCRRKRMWEIRVQGSFKRVPENPGSMYMGIVVRNFDYTHKVNAQAQIVKRLAMSMLVGRKIYMSFGDRAEHAAALARQDAEAELGQMVMNMCGWDQVVVTPPGEIPPELTGDFSGLGYARSDTCSKQYEEDTARAFNDITLDKTYTLNFWGVAQMVDVLNWRFTFTKRMFGPMDMSKFFAEWPLHMTMYELASDEGDTRHLESRKTYYVDFMFWSSAANIAFRKLGSRYNFLDAERDLEEARFGGKLPPPRKTLSSTAGGSGEDGASSAPSLSAGPAPLAKRLSWVPQVLSCTPSDHGGGTEEGAGAFSGCRASCPRRARRR